MGARQKPFATVLDPSRRVQEGRTSLTRGNGCIQGTYPLEPCRDALDDPEEPGEVPWYYLKNQQLLIVDLGGRYEDDRDE